MFGEILPEAEVSGRALRADGSPAAGAHVLVELRPMIPAGQPDAGRCGPEVVGGDWDRADARGRYRVSSRVRLSTPLAACVDVRATLLPASVRASRVTAGPVLRWTAVDGHAHVVVDVAADSVHAP